MINIAELHSMCIKTDSNFSVATNVNTVTASSVDLVGLFLKFSASDSTIEQVGHTRQLCCVFMSVPGIYLSEDDA